VNTLILTGRLARPAQLRNGGDTPRATFTLAVDRNNAENKVSWIPVTCFGRTAENVVEYTDKGHLVAIEGRIASGKYVNDAGDTVYTLDVIANRVEFLSRPRTATTTPESVDIDSEVA